MLETNETSVLVDCGLFQGLKKLRKLNWQKPGFDPSAVKNLLLTHTHIDHAGYLPRLVRDGYRGAVYCTPATRDLAELLLMDSAKIQEEDARWANKKGYSRHKPALPLYTSKDVEAALKLFEPVDYEQWVELAGDCRGRFVQIGHILGSAMIEMEACGDAGKSRTLVFSGDVGRYDMPLHPDPHPLPGCDILIVESTYGNRTHEHEPVEDQIIEPFNRTFERGGTVLIPSFAVGRAQQVTLILRRLMKAGKLPVVPIHIDSPMAIDATNIYSSYMDEHNLETCIAQDGRSELFPHDVYFHRSVDDSKRLNNMTGARVIISASGMMTAGRILHHLKRRLPDSRNLVVLVGYQADGTRGRALFRGAKDLRIHGEDVPVRAEKLVVGGLSGHADRDEILRWVAAAPRQPSRIFVTHGEPKSARAMAKALRERFGDVRVDVPDLGDGYGLS